jgi:ABC-type phosphate transport system auxiliary subunit
LLELNDFNFDDTFKDYSQENKFFYQFLRKANYEGLIYELSKINNIKYADFLSQGIPFNDLRIYENKFELKNKLDSNKDLQNIIQTQSSLKFAQSMKIKEKLEAINSNSEESGILSFI